GHLLGRGGSSQPDATRRRHAPRPVERRDALYRGLRLGCNRPAVENQPGNLRAIHGRPGVLSTPDEGTRRDLRSDRRGTRESVRALVFTDESETRQQVAGDQSQAAQGRLRDQGAERLSPERTDSDGGITVARLGVHRHERTRWDMQTRGTLTAALVL